MKRCLWIVGIAMIVASSIFAVATIAHSHAATISCTGSSGCSSPDICYFPDTDQSYCALPVGGSSSCSYGCCSNSDCGTGQTCYNSGTPFAYCALPASCTSNANCGDGYSCVSGKCTETITTSNNTGSTSSATSTGNTNSGSGSNPSGTISSGGTSSENTGSSNNSTASNSTQPSETSFSTSINSALNAITQELKGLDAGDIGITQSYTGSSSMPSTPQLLIDGTTDQSFSVGSSWTLNLASNQPNSSFTICAVISGVHTCTPNWGTTDANGNWTQTGTFPTSTIGSWTEWINFPNVATSNQILFTVGGTGTNSGTETSSGSTTNFPVTVLVTASALNVRSASNTSASLAGSETLYAGDEFTAVNEVVGQSVDGNDLWWVSSLGNYVWSGGTEVAGSGTGQETTDKNKGATPNSESVSAPTLVLNSTQGYNPTTNQYESTSNVLNPGDTYLILYGTFVAPANGVTNGVELEWNNGNSSVDVPASQMAYQSASQINISLGNLIPAGVTSFMVRDGGTQAYPSAWVTVTVNGGGGGTLTQTQVLAKIQSASSLAQAISFAEEAALSVTEWSGDGVEGATIGDPKTGTILANITEYIDSFNFSAASSSVSLDAQFLNTLAFSASTPVEAEHTFSSEVLNGLIPVADASGATVVGSDNYPGQTESCTIAGTNGVAHVEIVNGQSSAGGISSYSFGGSLGYLVGASNVMANVQSFINGLGAAQLTNNSGGDNPITVQLQNDLGPIGVSVDISKPNSAGGFSDSCNSNISENGFANAAFALGIQDNSQAYQQFLTNIVIHEVLHCMGLGHSTNPQDIMADGDTIFSSSANGLHWATSPPSIDPAEVAALKQLAAGSGILQAQDCDQNCAGEEWQGFKVNPNGTGEQCVDISDLCPDPSTMWNVLTQTCQTCQQLGYPDGWIADQHNGICTLSANGNPAPDVPLEPSPSVDSNICYCTSAGAVCLDSNGNEVSPSANFSCSSPTPAGEVCTCFAGQASCTDTNGNSVAVPSDFTCGSSSSGSGGAGYTCAGDGSCIPVENGATYPADDSTCSDACVAEDSYPQYACESSFCTYIGQGPDYSDPSCGGECSGD